MAAPELPAPIVAGEAGAYILEPVPTILMTLNTRTLAKLTLSSTLLLVAVGGFTRGSGSGYGCADRWPLCEDGLLGGFLPRWEYHMIIEWSHRWLAASVGVLAIALAISTWRHFRHRSAVVIPAIAAVAVIGIQAWVGRLIVKGNLAADLVATHLAISMAVVALLTIVVVTTGARETHREGPAPPRGWRLRIGVAAAMTFVVIIFGTIVHNLYFPGWPLMQNTLVPNLSDSQTITHFLHRVVAAILLAYLVYLMLPGTRAGLTTTETRLVMWAGGLYVVNVGLGAAHVFTQVSSALLVAAHLGVAAVVWSLLVAALTMAFVLHPTPAPGAPLDPSAGSRSAQV